MSDPFADIGDLLESSDNRNANRAYARASAARRGIDPDFADRLFTRESGYNPRAYNKETGAAGIGQMIPGTQKRFGLKDPHDAKQNIDASLNYLGELHKKFGGDTRRMAAGYFAGEGQSDRALANPKGNPKTQAYANAVGGKPKADPFADIGDLLEGSAARAQGGDSAASVTADAQALSTQGPAAPKPRPNASNPHLKLALSHLTDASGQPKGPASAIIAQKLTEEVGTRRSEAKAARAEVASRPKPVAVAPMPNRGRQLAQDEADITPEQAQQIISGQKTGAEIRESQRPYAGSLPSRLGYSTLAPLAKQGAALLNVPGRMMQTDSPEQVLLKKQISALQGKSAEMHAAKIPITSWTAAERNAFENILPSLEARLQALNQQQDVETPRGLSPQANQLRAKGEEYGKKGLKPGLAKDLYEGGVGMVPALAASTVYPPAAPAILGALSAGESYGEGASPGKALTHGLISGASVSGMGAAASALDRTALGALSKTAGRALANTGIGLGAQAAEGGDVVPQTPEERQAFISQRIFDLAFALMHKSGGKLSEKQAVEQVLARPEWIPEGATSGTPLPLGAQYPVEGLQRGSIINKIERRQPLTNEERAAIQNSTNPKQVEQIQRKVAEGKPLTKAEQASLPTEPEAPGTLQAQIDAVKAGNGRKVVLVTPGEQVPARHGLSVTDTAVGRFLYDANQISARSIRRKVGDGTYHELLGIVEPKSLATTEAVVARQDGVEQQAAVVSPENVPEQARGLQEQFPEATVTAEAPEQVIAERRVTAGQPPAGMPERRGLGERARGFIARTIYPEGQVDTLTGLQGAEAWGRAKDSIDANPKREVAYLDANDLKKFNDTHGHEAGDAYLAHVGNVIREEAAKAGISERDLFRTNKKGDEFALAGATGQLGPVVERIKQRVAEFKQGDVVGSISGGVGENSNAADAAMYADKQAFKGKKATELLPAAGQAATIAPNVGRERTARAAVDAGLGRSPETVTEGRLSAATSAATRDVTRKVLDRADAEIPGERARYEAKGAKTPEQQALQVGAHLKTLELDAAGHKRPVAHHKRFGDIQLVAKTPDGAKILLGKVDPDGKGVTYHMAQNPEHELLTNAHLKASPEDIANLPTVSWNELGTLGDAHPPTAVIQALGKKLNLPAKGERAASKEWRRLSDIPDDVAIEHFPEVFRNRVKQEVSEPQWADMALKQMEVEPRPNEPKIIGQWRGDVRNGGLGANRVDLIAKGMTVAGYDTYRDLKTFGAWSKKMVEDWGQSVKPKLTTIWEAATKASRQAQQRIGQWVKKFMDPKRPGQEGFISVGGQPSTRTPQPNIQTPPRATGKDFGGMDWVRSRLSNLDFVGTYERRGGQLGRQASELMRQAQVDIETGNKTQQQALPQLRRDMAPIIKQIEANGLPGLAEQMTRHLEHVGGKPQPFEKTAGVLKSAQYNLRLRFNPKSMIINQLQPLTTLWPHVSSVEFARLVARSHSPAVRKRLAPILGAGATKIGSAPTKSRIPDPFAKVSEANKVMGYLHGEKEARRLGLTGQAAERMAMDWAKKVEFDNSKWDVPPIMAGPVASTLLQFKGFTVKNIESIVNDVKLHQKDKAAGYAARAGKRIIAQLALGGARSFPGIKQIGGIVVVGALAKALTKAGMDEETANKTAEAVYYGAPALAGEDLSGSLMVIDPPYGDDVYEQLINFGAGPTISSVAKVVTEAKRAYKANAAGDKEKTIAAAKRGLNAVTPYPKMVESGIGAGKQLQGGEPVKVKAGDTEEELNKFEAVMKALGFTPVKQTKGYDEKDAYDWQKAIAGKSITPRAGNRGRSGRRR